MPTTESTPTLYQLRRDLSDSLEGKKLLYFDLLYWNHLCDAALGKTDDTELISLLTAVHERVADGGIICPIEYTTFVELYKQRLPDKRKATARLIDELSLGLVMVSASDRLFLEALRLMQAVRADKPFPPAPREEVWTRPAFLLGHGDFKSNELNPNDLARLNAQFLATAWRMSLAEVMEQLGENLPVSFDWAERVVTRLNDEKPEAKEGFSNYRDMYLAEVRGVLDVYTTELGDVFRYMFHRSGGDADSVSQLRQERSGASPARLVSAAFEKQDLSTHLPTVHVLATLYANVQWDAPRRYRANDIQDFSHAAAAMAYCDAFATERSLAALLKQSKLTTTFPTSVLASVKEVLAWLAPSTG